MRMVEPGSDLDLAQEPVGTEAGGELGMQHLDGHLAVMTGVVREVHRRHAAASDLAVDAIAILELGAQPFRRGFSSLDGQCKYPFTQLQFPFTLLQFPLALLLVQSFLQRS